jgi:hypothetical protein
MIASYSERMASNQFGSTRACLYVRGTGEMGSVAVRLNRRLGWTIPSCKRVCMVRVGTGPAGGGAALGSGGGVLGGLVGVDGMVLG